VLLPDRQMRGKSMSQAHSVTSGTGGTCYTIKCNMEECGWTEHITCWKITLVGKKANPVLRVNPGYNR
jgi:hypothetical protein